jgi:hypothetical protein
MLPTAREGDSGFGGLAGDSEFIQARKLYMLAGSAKE